MIKTILLLLVMGGTLFYTFHVQSVQETERTSQNQEFTGWKKENEKNIQETIANLESRMYDEALFSDVNVLKDSLQAHGEMFEYLNSKEGRYAQDFERKHQEIFGREYDDFPTLEEIQGEETTEFEKRRAMYSTSEILHSFYLENFELIKQVDGELVIDPSVYNESQKLYEAYKNNYISFEKYRQSLIGGGQIEPRGF